MIFLQTHGVSSGYATKIFKQYGNAAIIEKSLLNFAGGKKITIDEKTNPDHKAVYLSPFYVAENQAAARLKSLINTSQKIREIGIDKAIPWVQCHRQREIAITKRFGNVSHWKLFLLYANIQALNQGIIPGEMAATIFYSPRNDRSERPFVDQVFCTSLP
jgi:hypothetical protein